MTATLNLYGKKNVGPGQPRKVLDLNIARRAASIGCSMSEIAVMLGVARSTIFEHMEYDEDLKTAIEEGRDEGRSKLRRMQWNQAEQGNTGMLIWLGKQLLGQKDRTELAGDPENPLETAVRYVVEVPAPVADSDEWLERYAPKTIEGKVVDG